MVQIDSPKCLWVSERSTAGSSTWSFHIIHISPIPRLVPVDYESAFSFFSNYYCFAAGYFTVGKFLFINILSMVLNIIIMPNLNKMFVHIDVTKILNTALALEISVFYLWYFYDIYGFGETFPFWVQIFHNNPNKILILRGQSLKRPKILYREYK